MIVIGYNTIVSNNAEDKPNSFREISGLNIPYRFLIIAKTSYGHMP